MSKLISFYDLLTMIKNGNAPKKVIHFGNVYEWTGNTYIYESEDDYTHLSDWFLEGKMFDEVIEIVEEYKIEKINLDFEITDYNYEKELAYLESKINEEIDWLNERGNEDE